MFQKDQHVLKGGLVNSSIHLSYSLNSLKGVKKGEYFRVYFRGYQELRLELSLAVRRGNDRKCMCARSQIESSQVGSSENILQKIWGILCNFKLPTVPNVPNFERPSYQSFTSDFLRKSLDVFERPGELR